MQNYEDAIKLLIYQGKFHICLGLERISQILDLLGNPQDKIKVVHVAGTNGKGSVCAILSNILTKAGYKTGLYTSPHLFDYTERIKINGLAITKSDFSSYIFNVCNIAQQNSIYLTEFEILTAAAYKYFYDQKIDIACIETGLGGRLDATNAVKKPVLSIITSISLDHVDRLGDCIEKIAFEKSGIIKEKVSVLTAEDNAGIKVIRQVANSNNATVITPKNPINFSFEKGVNYAYIESKKYEFALLGLYQKQNLELVVEALKYLNSHGFEIKDSALIEGLETVKWPARLQYIKEKNIIIDGAHNVEGAKSLKASLDYYFPDMPRVWIYGSLKTKNYLDIAKILFDKNDKVYLCQFDNKNSINIEDLKDIVDIKIENISISENILDNSDSKWIRIISGSFYMIGEICKESNL